MESFWNPTIVLSLAPTACSFSKTLQSQATVAPCQTLMLTPSLGKTYRWSVQTSKTPQASRPKKNRRKRWNKKPRPRWTRWGKNRRKWGSRCRRSTKTKLSYSSNKLMERLRRRNLMKRWRGRKKRGPGRSRKRSRRSSADSRRWATWRADSESYFHS